MNSDRLNYACSLSSTTCQIWYMFHLLLQTFTGCWTWIASVIIYFKYLHGLRCHSISDINAPQYQHFCIDNVLLTNVSSYCYCMCISLQFSFSRQDYKYRSQKEDQYQSGSYYSPSASSTEAYSPDRHSKRRKSTTKHTRMPRTSTPARRPKKTKYRDTSGPKYLPLSDSDIDTKIAKIGELTPTSCKIWSFSKEKRLCQLWAEEEHLYNFNMKAHANGNLRDEAIDRISNELGIPCKLSNELYFKK